jgi:hypothetical protein
VEQALIYVLVNLHSAACAVLNSYAASVSTPASILVLDMTFPSFEMIV